MAVLALVAAGAGVLGLVSTPARASDAPQGRSFSDHVQGAKGPLGSGGGNLINHGGPVLAASTAIPIWWGAGFTSDYESGADAFLEGLVKSSYLGIAAQYMPGDSISTTAGPDLSDTKTPPPAHSPKVSTLASEVAALVGANNLDPNAVYLVFTSNFPSGASFCAWHGSAVVDRVDIKVAYLPNVASVPACQSPALQGNPYLPGTQSNMDDAAHEFMEAITDPDINAWYDHSGYEIADKCQTVYQTVTLGSTSWKIQEEWSNNAGGCVSSSS